MANLTPDELTEAITISDTDLLVIYPSGGPMLACQWSVVKTLIIAQIGTGFLVATNNLDDVNSVSTSRTNLGLGSAATQNVGTSGANVPLLNALNQWGSTQILVAGSTTVAPLQLTAGTNLTAAVSGSLEYDGTNLFYTDSSPTRHKVAMLDSPTMTGVPTVPTASPGTNTTQAASTAFVLANGAVAPTTALFTQTQTSGTNAAETTITQTAWNTRHLTTTNVNTISGASLSSNQITLPAGTYEIFSVQTITADTSHPGVIQVRWRNITDSTTALVANRTPTGLINVGGNVQEVLNGQFTIAGTKAFSLQIWNVSTGANGGTAISTGESEVYVSVFLRKTA